MTDIAILDTETLGLDPLAPVWDFACVRCSPDGDAVSVEGFQILHQPGEYLAQMAADGPMGAQLAADYEKRYDPRTALLGPAAAKRIAAITDGAIIAGSNPWFDMTRLDMLLRRNAYLPKWHYHPLDIPTLAHGFSCGRGVPIEQPWKSDKLSLAVGIDPAEYKRHTAMGDVFWCWDQFLAVMTMPVVTR